MKSMRFYFVAVLAGTLLFAACDSQAPVGVDQSTPEAAFGNLVKAINSDDWITAFQYMDDASQTTMLGSVTMGMYIAAVEQAVFKQDVTRQDAVYELLTSINVDVEFVKKNWGNPAVDPRESLPTAFSGITNRGEAMNQVMTYGKENFPDLVGDQSPIGMLANGTLADVEVDGDSATAKLKISATDAEGFPVDFSKRDGKWYFTQPR